MPKHIPPGQAELAVYINKQLKQQFKLICGLQELPMSKVVEELVRGYVEENRPKYNPFDN